LEQAGPEGHRLFRCALLLRLPLFGGGNGGRVNRRDLGEVLERITVVDNKAGILGGIKLWDAHHVGVEGGPQ